MIVTTEYVDISLAGGPMRTFVAAPKAEGEYPGIWCYSDIFQLTPPMLRFCVAGGLRICGCGAGDLPAD
jgi:carboxymethylenebutenolidase